MRYLSLICLTLLLAACAAQQPAKLSLELVSFTDLPGWNDDHIGEAIPALQRSCDAYLKKPSEASMGIAGKAGDWVQACTYLKLRVEDMRKELGDEAALRKWVESFFQAYAVSGPDGDEGLFTGYYEAQLHGSLKRGGKYQTPIYARPTDLVIADLGDFKPELKGQHITGKIVKGTLEPYDKRFEIEKNKLKNRAKVLVWVDDPVDAFFLAVQGSGRVLLNNGKVMDVGYDTQNGHKYIAIGSVLAEANQIERPVTMQKIRAWLKTHRQELAQEIMNANPSYVFFHVIEGDGPIGAEGVALTPKRSMAVDPAFVPLGVPLWLDTQAAEGAPLQRLMVAQDTGGAIKGGVRGDFYWGFGPEAEEEAGAMQSRGRYYVLLPTLKRSLISVKGQPATSEQTKQFWIDMYSHKPEMLFP